MDFSETASCAIRQAQEGLKQIRREYLLTPYRTLAIGNEQHVFVIMGLSHEVVQKVHLALLDEQFREIVSERACNILPYDSLLRIFEKGLPERLEYLSLQERFSPLEIHERLLKITSDDERLFYAANQGWDDSAIMLLSQREKPDPNRQFGPQLSTALHWAAFYGDYYFVVQLLNAGAAVNLTDIHGRTPLVATAMNNHVDVAELLLNHGADVAAMNYAGWTIITPYERRAFFSEMQSLLSKHAFAIEHETLDPFGYTLISLRERFLSQVGKLDDLLPLLREKYVWLREARDGIVKGKSPIASDASGSRETLDQLIAQLQSPFVVIMKAIELCRKFHRFQDGIDFLESIDSIRNERWADESDKTDEAILQFGLGTLRQQLGEREQSSINLLAAKRIAAEHGYESMERAIDKLLLPMAEK